MIAGLELKCNLCPRVSLADSDYCAEHRAEGERFDAERKAKRLAELDRTAPIIVSHLNQTSGYTTITWIPDKQIKRESEWGKPKVEVVR